MPHLDTDQFEIVAQQLTDAGLVGRQVDRTQAEFEHVYDISPDTAAGHVDDLFAIVIQQRAQQLSDERYANLVESFEAATLLSRATQADAFAYLTSMADIGQKIANEFLRYIGSVYEIRPEWEAELEVPLDTHVVQALVKLGCIREADPDAGTQSIINPDPAGGTRTRIAYTQLQTAMADAAASVGESAIMFDELWLEHRHYLSDPLFRDESPLADLMITQ